MKKINPVFNVNDYIISKDGKNYCKIINVNENNQYYKIIDLNFILKFEGKLYFTHQHNFKKSYKERYKKIGKSKWFNRHYNNKSLGEVNSIT